ncbi:MAG: DUF1289 domain-containing protein [Xanthomonadales bacterium]|nr:DUF1289 domain-containing protein [Xanthomonadales bacterium]
MTEPTVSELDPLTPCIGVCRLDAENVCVGCGRTLAEIARWSQMSRAEQRRVMAELAARLPREA